MRFFLEIKNNNTCFDVASGIQKDLEDNGLIYDPKNPEIVISIGGDGTFLRAINHFRHKKPIFIGINEGSLGYLCQFKDDDIEDLIDDIISQNFRVVKEFKLLQAYLNNEIYYAFNEMRFETNNGSTFSCNIDVNNNLLEHFVGDGVCFSTSIGSTGINRGLNGAVVDTDLEIIQLAEKAPVNSKFYKTLSSPLILSGDSNIELYNFNRENFLFCFDNFSKNINLQDDKIKISLSNKKVLVLMNKDQSFINKVHDSFIE